MSSSIPPYNPRRSTWREVLPILAFLALKLVLLLLILAAAVGLFILLFHVLG